MCWLLHTTAPACLQIFRKHVLKLFDQLMTIHEVTFVLSVLVTLYMLLGVIRPYLKYTSKQTHQIAEMLAQLPPEMDVEALIAQALGGEATWLP